MDIALLIKIGIIAIFSIAICALIFIYFYIWEGYDRCIHGNLFAAVMVTLLDTIALIFAVLLIIIVITAWL